MDAVAKRTFNTALNRLYRIFKVELAYKTTQEVESSSDDGFGDIGNNYVESDWVTVCEPIIPTGTSASSSLGNTLNMLSGGSVEDYSYEWISKIDLPLKTRVKYKDKQLSIAKKSDYSDIAGFFVYQLQDRSDHNG
ncbi:hypothetical protein [Apilactobacillus kunkeei]|uniref:Uncharacterized protein n=1 Tax=Apilactobacillus kunkeei TaxID=148814 RepID=A0A1L8CFT4_9LACO|nr:hypothetical protein [Apilactobacillus kunkeei]GAT90054.1 hypothetical protein FF306_00145 [Apilactobacillus kunkeei]